MKKILIASLIAVFAIASVSLYAGPGCRDKMDSKCKMGKGEKCCDMCGIDANVKVTNTKDGVTITISAKEGGADAKAIQEAAKGCCCLGNAKCKMAGESAVTCPVSGEKVKTGKDAVSAEHDGKTYYFCCEDCKEKFLKEPKKYIKN